MMKLLTEPRRVIILEGIEGAGKSTIAKELEDLGWGSVHFSYQPEGDRVSDWLSDIAQAAARSENGRVVVDRMNVSEGVYGKLIRGYSDLTDFDNWLLDGWLMARGGIIYYLGIRNHSLSRQRVQDKFGDLINLQSLQYTFIRELRNRNARLRYTISDALTETLNTYPPLPKIPDRGIGHTNPRFWFVRDSQGRRDADFRFGIPLPHNKDISLYHALRVLDMRWEDMYISDGDRQNLRERWENLRYPKTVAVGRKASDLLSDYGVSHCSIHHPSYRYRHHRYDILGYASQIRDAISN